MHEPFGLMGEGGKWDALTIATLAPGVMLGKLVVHNILNRTAIGVILNSPQLPEPIPFTTGEHVPWQVELIPSSAGRGAIVIRRRRNTNVQAPTEEPLCAVQRRAKLPGGPPLGDIPTRPTPPDVAKGGYSALTGNK